MRKASNLPSPFVSKLARPELLERIECWPSYAIEMLIGLNKLRRAGTPSHLDNQTAMESVRHTRAWWRYSSAHAWPTRGKRADDLRAGIEPGLLTLHKLKARLIREGDGAAIVAPFGIAEHDLREALGALGLDHLPVRWAEPERRHLNRAA